MSRRMVNTLAVAVASSILVLTLVPSLIEALQ